MRIRTGLVAGLLLTLTVTGCADKKGSDEVASANGKGAATASAKPTQNIQEQMLRFAQCMRENGVPDFPDPEVGEGGRVTFNMPRNADPRKADAAQAECKQNLPNGGEPEQMDPQRLEQLRQVAQCMRDHGITNFPDPTDGGIRSNRNELGMDPNDPKFEAAQRECDKLAPKPPSGGPGGGPFQNGGHG